MTRTSFLDRASSKGLGTSILAPMGSSSSLHPYAALALQALQTKLEAGYPRPDRAKEDRAKEAPSESRTIAHLKLTKIWSHGGEKTLMKVLSGEGDRRETFQAYVDRKGRTALLEDTRALFLERRPSLDYSIRQVLEHEQIFAYLFERVFTENQPNNVQPNNVMSAEGVYNGLVRPRGGGWTHVHDYILERSVWLLKDERHIAVDPVFEKIFKKLKDPRASLKSDELEARLSSAVEQVLLEPGVLAISEEVIQRVGTLSVKDHAYLLKFLSDRPTVELVATNVPFFVAHMLEVVRTRSPYALTAADAPLVADDYVVDYYADAEDTLEFDSTSIEAAAQLYYALSWGDELGLFEVVDRIAAQTSSELRLEIRSKDTLQDFQLYVLDERFRDLKTGEISRRISRAEREMFYRQVFGAGASPVTDGMRVNHDFPRLWAVLMTEVARYIGKVEESSNTSTVSKEKIRQAMNDLRYNLSSECSSMAKVAAPVIYKEMDFVIRRILGSKDVLAMVGGASFWKVVEKVRGTHQLTPLRNKGRLGHKIISTIARDALTDEASFQDFVANVEAFIVAESQLAAISDPAAKTGQELPDMQDLLGNGLAPLGGGIGASPTQDQWNF